MVDLSIVFCMFTRMINIDKQHLNHPVPPVDPISFTAKPPQFSQARFTRERSPSTWAHAVAYVSANGWRLLPADPDVAGSVAIPVASVEDVHRISRFLMRCFMGLLWELLWEFYGNLMGSNGNIMGKHGKTIYVILQGDKYHGKTKMSHGQGLIFICGSYPVRCHHRHAKMSKRRCRKLTKLSGCYANTHRIHVCHIW